MSDESNYQQKRTSSDELRDRIADILADTYSPGGRGVQFEDVVAAQAIIDDLGLEVGSRTIGDVTDDHQGNATAIVDAHNTLPNLLTAVEKVLELHEPVCVGTLRVKGEANSPRYGCVACNGHYPCHTVRAIEGASDE